MLNSNITKIEVLGFCVCVCFYVTYFCSFLSRMSIVFDFFLLLKTSCHIIGMINRCCQIGSRDNWCHLYALPKKFVWFGVISVGVMSKRWFEIVFLLQLMPLSFGYHKWWLNLFPCTIFCSLFPLSSAVHFLYLETFVFWSSAHNGVYITVSLQIFSLSTFSSSFFWCLHIVFHFLMFAFDCNCEMTLLIVSYYASQDTLLWAEDMCSVLWNALSKVEYLLSRSASYKST